MPVTNFFNMLDKNIMHDHQFKTLLNNIRENQPDGIYFKKGINKQNQTVFILDLAHQNITSAQAQDLSEALKSNSTITDINLANNQINYRGFQFIGDALKNKPNVRRISIAQNSKINEKDYIALRYIWNLLDKKTNSTKTTPIKIIETQQEQEQFEKELNEIVIEPVAETTLLTFENLNTTINIPSDQNALQKLHAISVSTTSLPELTLSLKKEEVIPANKISDAKENEGKTVQVKTTTINPEIKKNNPPLSSSVSNTIDQLIKTNLLLFTPQTEKPTQQNKTIEKQEQLKQSVKQTEKYTNSFEITSSEDKEEWGDFTSAENQSTEDLIEWSEFSEGWNPYSDAWDPYSDAWTPYIGSVKPEGEDDSLIITKDIFPNENIDILMLMTIIFRAQKPYSLLVLDNLDLTDDDIKKLAFILSLNKVFESVYITNNRFGDVGVKHLVDMLTKNKTITELDLSGNLIGANSMYTLKQYQRIPAVKIRADQIQTPNTNTASLLYRDITNRNMQKNITNVRQTEQYSIDLQQKFLNN